MYKLLILPAALLAASVAHAAGKPHVHGTAKLDVAVEDRKVTLDLDSPLDNLLGFEHPPRTDAERQLSASLVARLRAADTLFKIDPAAHCRLTRVELASTALDLGHPDPSEAGHADIDGTFEFDCVDAAKVAWIDVGLFDYARLQSIEVQVATPSGQFRRDLKRPTARLLLTK